VLVLDMKPTFILIGYKNMF